MRRACVRKADCHLTSLSHPPETLTSKARSLIFNNAQGTLGDWLPSPSDTLIATFPPTEINGGLRSPGTTPLGEILSSAVLDHEKSEGLLALQIVSGDKRLLNLARRKMPSISAHHHYLFERNSLAKSGKDHHRGRSFRSQPPPSPPLSRTRAAKLRRNGSQPPYATAWISRRKCRPAELWSRAPKGQFVPEDQIWTADVLRLGLAGAVPDSP